MPLGKLLVDIAANVASFQSDMGKVAHIAEKTADKMKDTFNNVGKAIVTYLGYEHFKEFIKGGIEAADSLNDLAQITGIAHEQLASYLLVARQSGLANEDFAKSIEKLGKSIGKASGGDQQAKQFFDAFNIGAEELKKGDLTGILDSIAKKFNTFEPGNAAAKIDLLTEGFGKSGANMIPFLKSLEETGDAVKRISSAFTKDVSEAADEFNDKLELMKTASLATSVKMSAALLPTLTKIVDRLMEFNTNGESMTRVAQGIATVFSVLATVAEVVAEAFFLVGNYIGTVANIWYNVAQGKFAAAWETMKESAKVSGKSIIDTTNNITKYWSKAADDQKKKADEIAKTPVPVINRDSDAKLKKDLEQRLKTEEIVIEKEKTLLANRNEALSLYYNQDYISLTQYYQQRRQATDEAVSEQVDAYDRQVDALENYLDKAKKQSDQVDTVTKINEVLAKKSKLETEASANGTKLWFEEQAAVKQFQDKLIDLQTSLDEITHNNTQAASARFDQTNESFRKRLELEGRKADLEKLDRLRTLTVAQARYSQYSDEAQLVQDKLANTEEQLTQNRDRGFIGEIQYMLQLSEARKKTVEDLQTVYEAQVKVAEASGDPRLIQNAEAFRLRIDKLKSSSDVLANTLSQIGESSFSTFLTDIITGSEKASDAFKKMAVSILSDLAKLIAQAAAKQIFQGVLGGGSSGGATSAAAGGIAAFIADLFKADGGPVVPGRPYVVGERGPELIVPTSHGNVIPNHALGGGSPVVVNNHFTINGNTDRRSQQQIASEVGLSVNRATKRNK